MKLEHIKLFEEFSPLTEKVLIGDYGEGGHGSHPSFLTEETLKENGFSLHSENHWKNEDRDFYVLMEEPKMPNALSTYIDADTAMWEFKRIDLKAASDIINENGGITIYSDAPAFNKACELLGKDPQECADKDASISFIVHPMIDKVYWSDAPEESHGPWENGEPKSLEDIVNKN